MANNFAFIDGQNLHFGVKSMGWKLDHKKFRQYLTEEHEVTKAYIFLGFMEEHQDLYNVLQESGFICFFKPLVRYDDGTIKGNVDADMVLQVMVDIENYDKAIIVSGDGDFSGLVRYLATKDKLGRIIIPNRDKYSSLFDRIDGFDAEHVTYMNDLRTRLSYGFAKRPFTPRPRQDSPKVQTQTPTNVSVTAQPTPKSNVKPVAAPPAASEKPTDPRQPQNNSGRPARKFQPKRQGQKPGQNKQQNRGGNNSQTRDNRSFTPKSEIEKSLINTIDSI